MFQGLGLGKHFRMNLVQNGYTGEVLPELDPVRSEFPPSGSANVGVHTWAAGAGADLDSFFQVPSGHAFHLRYVMAMYRSAMSGLGWIFDGPGTSVPAYWFHIPPQVEGYVVLNDIKGVVLESVVCASIENSNVLIKIGGLIRERTVE